MTVFWCIYTHFNFCSISVARIIILLYATLASFLSHWLASWFFKVSLFFTVIWSNVYMIGLFLMIKYFLLLLSSNFHLNYLISHIRMLRSIDNTSHTLHAVYMSFSLCSLFYMFTMMMWTTFRKLFFYNGIIIIYHISYYGDFFFMLVVIFFLFHKCIMYMQYMHRKLPSKPIKSKSEKDGWRFLRIPPSSSSEIVWWSEEEENGALSNFMNHLIHSVLERSFITKTESLIWQKFLINKDGVRHLKGEFFSS